jgi:DNA-binding NarL/FixJ family response regulator
MQVFDETLDRNARSGEAVLPETVTLTAREKEILRCLAQGMSTVAIATKLAIAAVTVRNHVQKILQKLDVHSKLQAVVLAHHNKLI